MTSIKAIAFDVNGVLASHKNRGARGIHEFMAKNFKISLDTWFDAIDIPYENAIEGKFTRRKTLQLMSKDLHSSPEKIEKIFKKAYRVNFKRNSELYNLAFNLRKKGYKIAIISDQWYISAESNIKSKDKNKFDLVLISCYAKMRKFSDKIFKTALKKLKVKPSELLFIDDRDWNTKTAAKLGIKTTIFKNNKQFRKELNKLGVKVR